VDNETLGLPGGLNIRPLSPGDFFGLTPGCDFGNICAPIGNSFVGVDDAIEVVGCAAQPEICGAIALGVVTFYEIERIRAQRTASSSDSTTDTTSPTDDECKQVREDCHDECRHENTNPKRLPQDNPGQYRKCLRQCMNNKGCYNI
jgi:hypothetical protein